MCIRDRSRWNSEVSRGKAILRVAQPSHTSTAVSTGEDLSWTTYLAGRKSYKLMVTEESEEFSMDMQDGCEVKRQSRGLWLCAMVLLLQ